MKNLFAIVFVALLLLNVMGYYGVFIGLQYKNDREMISRFDADDYSESETVAIKIPISIPYASDQAEFERVDGKFEHKGEFYRLVKQKLSQDTLYVVCVKDKENKKIDEAMTSLVKTFTDKPVDTPTNSKLVVSFTKDYIPQSFEVSQRNLGWVADVFRETAITKLTSSFCPSIAHPPERG